MIKVEKRNTRSDPRNEIPQYQSEDDRLAAEEDE